MGGNASVRLGNTAMLAVCAVDAPQVVTSAAFDERLAGTYARVGMKPGMLEKLAGVVERPTGDEARAAREAHLAAVSAAKYYIDYSDFTVWVLRVRRVRWVGGYGRMDSCSGADYAAAEPDPVAPHPCSQHPGTASLAL